MSLIRLIQLMIIPTQNISQTEKEVIENERSETEKGREEDYSLWLIPQGGGAIPPLCDSRGGARRRGWTSLNPW